ncbi:MAG TPA: M24 family metallopeptidase, partial [Deinococcales bacterium]|nr:M24 family metallopeptidase [Deinococcales bacterium]
WIVTAREYNEDPVLLSLLPAPMLSARRRTVLVFHAPEGGPFRALAIANAGIGLDGFYETVWAKTMTALGEETQEECLRRVVTELNPERLGINTGAVTAFADGLSAGERDWLEAALGAELWERTVPAEPVVIGWLETRLPVELAAADAGNRLAHALIAEAFSGAVVQPGVTRATDVAWWLRERTRRLGLACWFQPTVAVQRHGEDLGPPGSTPDTVIMPGDLLHCDFGLHHLGLATDTQQNAYVRHPGESDAPAGLKALLQQANRQQDLLAANMRAGATGNDVLLATLAAMREAGIPGRIYSHPIGVHGHGAGAYIGRFDLQEPLPGPGEFPVADSSLYSFEMYTEGAVPEWDGQVVRLATEQIVAFSGGRVSYLGGGRQTALHLI